MVSFPLPVSVHIAPGANPAAASTFQFTEITTDVLHGSAVQIKAGRSDETSDVGTGSHQLALNNQSGNYSRRNPLGSMYGQLRSGTPIQTRVKLIDDLFARTVASGLGTEPVSGQAWTAGSPWSANGSNGACSLPSSNTASLATLGSVLGDDVEIFKVTSLSAVPTGGAWVDATAVRVGDISNFMRVHTEFTPAGVIAVKISRVDKGTVTDLLSATTTSVAFSAGTKIATRVQAVGPTIRIKVWLASGSEPAAWSGSVDTTFTTVRGNAVGLYEWRLATNASSLTASIYEYRCDVIRATTPVPQWSPRWDQTSRNATTPVVGAGILRRLGQGASTVRSPMYLNIGSYTNLVGYWPIEDGSDSTALTNTVKAGRPGQTTDMQLGVDGPAGSTSAATFTDAAATSQMSGVFLPASTSAGWQFSWTCKLSALPSALTQMIIWWTSNGDRWAINLNTGVYNLHVIDKDGSLLLDSNISNVGSGDPNQWIAFRVKATVSGGTVSAEFAWYAQGAGTVWGATGTYSGSTVGALKLWAATGNASMQGGSMCQVFGVTTGNDDLQSYAALRAFDGYVGELAGDRVLRLAAQESVPVILMGDSSLTAPMGAQSPGTFLDLIRECEDAEQGLVIERGAGLGFITYRFRVNVPVAMALDFNARHIADPPEPTDDDLNLINVVNLTRKGGSEVTAEDASSIALSGAYSTDLTVNLQTDDQLFDQAGWRLHMGTIDELRWPVISLQLHRNPSLIPTWCGLRIGSRITIANPPSAVAGAQLDLILEGYTETITNVTWDVDLNCSPASAWDVGVWGTTRYDPLTTTTNGTLPVGTVGQTGVSLAITTVLPDEVWSTTAVPYTWTVAGEQMTVTAMTAASGTGPFTQNATVTRGVNSLVKAHVASEQIQLADSRVYAL
jgi:hypothetical protein